MKRSHNENCGSGKHRRTSIAYPTGKSCCYPWLRDRNSFVGNCGGFKKKKNRNKSKGNNPEKVKSNRLELMLWKMPHDFLLV